MKLTTKKWLAGFVLGLIAGSVLATVYASTRPVNVIWSNTGLDMEKAYKSGGLVK
jgi:hypothetical protein